MGERVPSPPVAMSASSGPLDPHEFYVSSFESSPTGDIAPPLPQIHTNRHASANTQRSVSQSPVRKQLRAASGPAGLHSHALNGAASNPALLAARRAGSVKDIANKFNQGAVAAQAPPQPPPPLAVRTSQDRFRRSPAARGAANHSPDKSDTTTMRLQKRRPPQPKSPCKSPATSFDTSGSFSSNATLTSTKSQPHAAFLPKDTTPVLNHKPDPYITIRPLFGEVTADGSWHANFGMPTEISSVSFQRTSRRMSEGSLALGHGRSQSHQDIASPRYGPTKQVLQHRRSRSHMDVTYPQQVPSMPNLQTQNLLAPYPTPPDSASRNSLQNGPPMSSRIPISSRPQSQDSGYAQDQQSRSASTLSNHASGKQSSRSPTRMKPLASRENTAPSAPPRSRYQPPPLSTGSNGQSLSARIVAPPPKLSPSLRSSRPRQPVSSATTSASRARAAERFQGPATKDGRKPSEQWMGKPYDPQREQTNRKIPELGKVDFAARRARIQKAISQSLEQSSSRENLKTASREVSGQQDVGTREGAHPDALNEVDRHQADEMNKETDAMIYGEASADSARVGGLSLDTTDVGHQAHESAPNTARTEQTEFDWDESPVLGHQQEPKELSPEGARLPSLLTSETYEPRSATARPPNLIQTTRTSQFDGLPSPTVLENVMRMRQRSPSSPASKGDTDFADDSPRILDSPSDIGERWGIASGMVADQGSINIMLDGDSGFKSHSGMRPESTAEHDYNRFQGRESVHAGLSHALNERAFASNGFVESPANGQDECLDESLQETPRKRQLRNDTLKPEALHLSTQEMLNSDSYQHSAAFTATRESLASNDAIASALDQYQATGTISPEMLQLMQGHMLDFKRLSANGGSDAIMIQNLLDSIVDGREVGSVKWEEPQVEVDRYGIPLVTPNTPPNAALMAGSAVVFGNEAGLASEEDFHAKIRKADEEWERQQRGEDAVPGAENHNRPRPPPKDEGYTPRSSTGPDSASLFPPNMDHGLRISTSNPTVRQDFDAAGDSAKYVPVSEKVASPTLAPPLPRYAPPPPPSPLDFGLPYGMPEVPQMPAAMSERGSSEVSPRVRRSLWGQPGSSRPSTDSQRPPPPIGASQSMSSFADSTRHNSIDIGGEGQPKLIDSQSPGPEQKRLMKRRHIIKELLDTENSYHQDLKIIEDIYKATVADLISPEDKKTLFGNCDEIEKFSLHFYDELRKAVVSIYVPAKQMRWAGQKRGSHSTTQSDGTGQTSTLTTESVDQELDRTTTIGKCFQENLHRMDQVYGAYLKNHDAANARLSALKNTPTIKCWLDECHNNASDITSAWDLDSLLVKPTQRVSKYPMLLQQLAETTPADHPDYAALKAAASDTISMLTRINEAKKRADIVDQIINRKGKDTDVRSGIAKAFGRGTEKLKERVGIGEVFQDPEFDILSHRFGGHFIRLQICMRDVQDYLHRIDRSMDQITNCASALELFTDVSSSSLPEIESKWRRYGQAIREIAVIAFPEHKSDVNRRVIQPMVTCIKLHDGPQNAINKRKGMVVDYAKCKAVEKRGEKPDKKTVEAAEKYEAVNHQLKLELPKLYSLTGTLVQGCLDCFLDIQMTWYNMWERKLRPILEEADFPEHIETIVPAFRPDYDLVKNKLTELAICNGALLAESANFLSPAATLVPDSEQSSLKRPATLESSKRTLSVGSENSPSPGQLNKRHSSSYGPGFEIPQLPPDGRVRSSSSMSTRVPSSQNSAMAVSANRPWSNSNTPTPNSSLTTSRPATANLPPSQYTPLQRQRDSADDVRSPRPFSSQTYVTARGEQPDNVRFSGIFNSAMPGDNTPDSTRPSSRQAFNEDTPVLKVCASLFEFSIDKTRKEGGYPYLTYVQGEVFDVVAQKGELWLAKNQDDESNTLGWIWEQHFVTLSQ